MGWSFRKSAKLGPFRLNFSESGLGVSVGVKGARLSFSQRGTYVNLGANGIYYRKRIDGPGATRPTITQPTGTPQPQPYVAPNQDPHTITTVNFDNLTDIDSQQFIDELQEKDSKKPLLKWLGIFPSIVLVLGSLVYVSTPVRTDNAYRETFTVTSRAVHIREIPSMQGKILRNAHYHEILPVLVADTLRWTKILVSQQPRQVGYIRSDLGEQKKKLISSTIVRRFDDEPWKKYALVIVATACALAWCVFLRKVDYRRRTLEIYYQMDGDLEKLHQQFLTCFQNIMQSQKIWQTLHSQQASDWKTSGGASSLVKRVAVDGISRDTKPSFFLKTNVPVPHIRLRNTALYFFPERMVLKRQGRFAALQYKNIAIDTSSIRFIEEDPLPADAKVVDYTWKYVNKDGGPDRRFADNRQLPICRYSEYHLKADVGLNEVITTSKIGAMDDFAAFIQVIGKFQQKLA